jgi:topoisomerase-4 subunit A
MPCRSVDTLYVLGSNGRVYNVAVSALPGGRGDGLPLTSLIDLESGTQPAHYLAAGPQLTLLLANSSGYGLLARSADLNTRQKGGKSFLTLEPGERLLAPLVVPTEHRLVACLAQSGRLLVFPLAELKLQSNGGRGLSLMEVDVSDPLISIATCVESLRVQGLGRGGKPKDELIRIGALAAYMGKRARKGLRVDGVLKPERVLAGG